MKLKVAVVCFLSIINAPPMENKQKRNRLIKSADCIHSEEYKALHEEEKKTILNAEKTIGKKLTKFSNAHAPLFKVTRPKVLFPSDDDETFIERNKAAIIASGIVLGIGGAALLASGLSGAKIAPKP